MADGLCSGDPVGDVIEKTTVKDFGELVGCERNDSVNVECASGKVNSFYLAGGSDKFFDKLCGDDDGRTAAEGFLPCEDDCRKKRCVDRYDSSESSDSGVAVLSCTDCSGSSTASSDITDPGSPFSTASSHSEDSGTSSSPPSSSLQSATKMPPTQTAHHPPWPWTAEEGPPIINKRSMIVEKTAFPKRLKSTNEDTTTNTNKQSPPCLINNNNTSNNNKVQQQVQQQVGLTLTDTIPSPNDNKFIINNNNNNNNVKRAANIKKNEIVSHQVKQGKITEYFKSQVKLHVVKNSKSSVAAAAKNLSMGGSSVGGKSVALVDQQTQFNGIRLPNSRPVSVKKGTDNVGKRKIVAHHQVTVPRKILPAPSKIPDGINRHHPHHHHVNNLANFAPTVTLTAVSFPPNLTYLHTKTPKPPDNSGGIFVPQFATITDNKTLSTIPIINRTPCLNVIHQPVQKITTINCVKLNATVVPIVKLNTLPSRLNGTTLSVETAVPTVLSAKPKVVNNNECGTSPNTTTTTTTTAAASPKQQLLLSSESVKCRTDEIRRLSSNSTTVTPPSIEEDKSSASSPADSDSGISSLKDNLEVVIGDLTTIPPQKSPILSQPKTIRFPPAKQEVKEDVKDTKSTHSQESGLCRWADCSAQFDTSGALLEHLQVKHVITQKTQEQYVCFWLGCKVHGRTSCSRTWLERHVLAHAGTKPFRCIVDGCGQRFNSQLTLERHVNGHFNGDGGQNGSAKKSTETTTTKLFKRNGKKIRFRRQPWSARMFDFIDSGIMEGLQHKLLTMTEDRTLGRIHHAGDSVNVLSQVLARRVEADGNVKFLVRWQPADILPDEWVSEKEYVSTKSVPIPNLDSSGKTALHSHLFPERSEKRRRKPLSRKQQQQT